MTKDKYIHDLVSSLTQTRDELRVKAHLANAEIKHEWDRLEEKYRQMTAQYEPAKQAAGETAENVWESIKLVGEELRDGFHRIRESM